MFRNIDKAQSGAFATLDAKAKKLTGAEVNPNETQSAYARILTAKQADVFVSYCTNATTAQQQNPAITYVRVPTEFDVISNYSIGIAPGASESARNFLRFILSERARPVLRSLGFVDPKPECGAVEDKLKAAYAAWMRAPQSLDRPTMASPPPPERSTTLEIGKRYAVLLQPTANLKLNRTPRDPKQLGAVLSFAATESGHLEVFADRRGWIDVIRVRDGKPLDSIRSDRWLGCAGVGKNLGFRLEASENYRLELSEMEGATAQVLLIPMKP